MSQQVPGQAEKPEIKANNRSNAAVAAFLLFFLLNGLKLALFNFYLLPEPTAEVFVYKLMLTLLSIAVVYPLLYKACSRVALAFIYILQSLYILVYMGYYFYFRSYLNVLQWVSLLREAVSVAGNAAVPLDIRMLVVLMDLPCFVYILAVCKGPGRRHVRLGRTVWALMLASILAIAAIEGLNHTRGSSLFQLVDDTYSGESPIIERYGTITAGMLNLSRYGSNEALAGELQYGKEQSFETVREAAADTYFKSAPNYILIQVESLDANIVNQTYKGLYVTPFLHSLTTESIYYPYALSYHKGGGTSDSEFSVLNSMEPLNCYPALKLSNYSYPNSVAACMKEASYTTLAFHGNTGSFYNRDVAYPKLGFANFYDMDKMGLPEIGWGVPDHEVFNFAFERLGAATGPFFASIITMTSHEPYDSARNYYSNSLYDNMEKGMLKEYYNAMSYVDQSLQEFIGKVTASFKNTYIIIYGDHTPGIHSPGYSQAAFMLEGRYFEFVPVMILTPDGRTHKETEKAASFLDIAPTVLKTSGISFHFKSDGADLTEKASLSGSLPFKGGRYDKSMLFKKASQTAAARGGPRSLPSEY